MVSRDQAEKAADSLLEPLRRKLALKQERLSKRNTPAPTMIDWLVATAAAAAAALFAYDYADNLAVLLIFGVSVGWFAGLLLRLLRKRKFGPTMRGPDISGKQQVPDSTLATVEIWLGVSVIAVLLVHHVFSLFGFGLELRGVFALLPLLLTFAGATLVFAGGAMRRFPDDPVFCNLPLLLWFAVFILAFL